MVLQINIKSDKKPPKRQSKIKIVSLWQGTFYPNALSSTTASSTKYHPQWLQSSYLPPFFYSVSLLTLRASLQHENSKDSTLAQNTSDICHNHVTGSSIQLDEEMKIPLQLTLPTPQLVSPRSVWSISLHGSHPPSISLFVLIF